MTTYYRFILMGLGLFMCINVFSQTLPFQKGSILLKNGDKLEGFVTLMNSQKVLFKAAKEKGKTTYKAKKISAFSYGDKQFQTITYKRSTFFVRKIAEGQVSLYKRDFAPNKGKAYFVETSQGFQVISKSNYYEDLSTHMSGLSVFDNYDKDVFEVAYAYNQTDLSDLVYNYNLEKPKTMLAYDFVEPIDSMEEEILGFAVSTPNGSGNHSKTTRIPNTVRNDLVLKSEVIYAQIIDALKVGNWKKINNALKHLKPLGVEVGAYNDNNLYNKLVIYAKQQEHSKFKTTFVLFVSNGVQALMKSAVLQNKTNMRKLVVRQAFVEFLEIRTELQKLDAVLSGKITKQFKTTFANAANAGQFKVETTKISASFKSLNAKV